MAADEGATIAAMEDLLDRLSSRSKIRHVALGAASLDGAWSWKGAKGEANPDGTPMLVDTPWFLASVTKLYIAATILILHERGRIDIGAPMAEYLPEGMANGLHVIEGHDYTSEITTVHLLGHLTGLPDSLDERPKGEISLFEEAIESDRSWSFEDAIVHARDRLVPHFPPSDPATPKARIRYSDTNYQLLMVIVQEVTGRPIEAVFRELLFEPLGLHATWRPGGEPISPAGEPATVWLGNEPFIDRPLALASTGDLYSTTEDVLRFGRGLFSGEAFDDPRTVDVMSTRFNRFGFPRGMAALRAPSWPIEYGLGMMRFELSRLLAGGRRIPGVIGHTGSTGSWLWLCSDLDLLIAGTVDQVSAPTVPFRQVPRYLTNLDG